MVKYAHLQTKSISINGPHKNTSQVGPGMIPLDVFKAELLAFKLPLLWALLGSWYVVSGHWKIRVGGLRCPSIECKGYLSREILYISNKIRLGTPIIQVQTIIYLEYLGNLVL